MVIPTKISQRMMDEITRPNPLLQGVLNDFAGVRVETYEYKAAGMSAMALKAEMLKSMDDLSDANRQKQAEALAYENMKDTDYSRRIVIAAGEQVSCPNGHYVATCTRTQYKGETVKARDFGGWRGRPEPQPGERVDMRCVECGAAFMLKVTHCRAFAIFVAGRGWSDRAQQPQPPVVDWTGAMVASHKCFADVLLDVLLDVVREDNKRFDDVIAAARERKTKEYGLIAELKKPATRELRVKCSGNSLAAALAVPLMIEGELHDVVMPYRVRG